MKDKVYPQWKKLIGSFFYLGRLKGGGTYTAIVGAFIVYFFLDWNSFTYMGFLILLTIFSIVISIDLQNDPGWFTLDELTGILFTFVGHNKTIPFLIIGFVAFRILDIYKPPFIKKIEHKKAGIVMDDIIAGLLANAFGWIIILLRSL